MKHLHFVRHAEGTHNVGKDYKSPSNLDAQLTQFGQQQCKKLEELTRELDLELVVSSPLTRTIQTAQFGFASVLRRGVPLMVEESCRETVNYLCDCRRTTTALRVDFPSVDFSRIISDEDLVWVKYAKIFGDQQAFPFYRESNDPSALTDRIASMFSFLATRPEKSIAIVSHSAFLTYVFNMTGGLCEYADSETERLFNTPWENCEMRSAIVDLEGSEASNF